MRAATFIAVFSALLCAALAASYDGYVLGIEGKCGDLFCTKLALDFVRIDSSFPKRLVQVTPMDQQPTTMSFHRFAAYDTKTKLYYFVTSYQPDQEVKPVINLYTIDTVNANVTNKVELDTSSVYALSNMQVDPNTGTLYAMYETTIATICPHTGNVTVIKQFLDGDYTNLFPSDFDSANQRYLTHVYNAETDSHHIAIYNVTTGATTVTGPIGVKGDLTQIVQYMAYDPTSGNIYAVANSRMGSGVIEIDLAKDTWSDLIPADSPTMQPFTAMDADPVRSGLSCFDPVGRRLLVNMKEAGTGGQTVMAAIVVEKKWVDTLSSLTQDATNYVFVHA